MVGNSTPARWFSRGRNFFDAFLLGFPQSETWFMACRILLPCLAGDGRQKAIPLPGLGGTET
jgi:hypothetical protein